MTGYLPRTVAVGDKLRLAPSVREKQDNGSNTPSPQPLTGEVVYIHPKRRFATVRFLLTGYDSTGHRVDKSFRECWHILPDERRLAHKELEDTQAGRKAGTHNREPSRLMRTYPTQRKIREYRERQGLKLKTVAARTGASDSTISKWELGHYAANWEQLERGLPGVTAYVKKAAAGSASSDSGKG